MKISDTSKSKSEYLNPFQEKKGDYIGKNRIEQYLRLIFHYVDANDGWGLKEIFDELNYEQYQYIWFLLASYTRTKIKKLMGEL